MIIGIISWKVIITPHASIIIQALNQYGWVLCVNLPPDLLLFVINPWHRIPGFNGVHNKVIYTPFTERFSLLAWFSIQTSWLACDRRERVSVTGNGFHLEEIMVKIKWNKDLFVGFLSSFGYWQLHESLFEMTKKIKKWWFINTDHFYKPCVCHVVISGCLNDE